MLIVQGSRDPFGTPAELVPALTRLSPPAALHVVENGDHSFKVLSKDPTRQAAVYDEVQGTILAWVRLISEASAPETEQRRR